MVPHYDGLRQGPVGEMMTEAVVNIEPTAPLTGVFRLMLSLKSGGFPVIGLDRQLAGIISREDVILALNEVTQASGKPARSFRAKSDTEAMAS